MQSEAVACDPGIAAAEVADFWDSCPQARGASDARAESVHR